MSGHTIRHDAQQRRFTIHLDGVEVGHLDYAERPGDVLDFHHTYVEPAFRGRGLSAELIREALDWARAEGATVVPSCWAVDGFMDRNAEYGDLRRR